MRAAGLVHDLNRTSNGRFLAGRFADVHAVVSENFGGKDWVRPHTLVCTALIALTAGDVGWVSVDGAREGDIIRGAALVDLDVVFCIWLCLDLPCLARFPQSLSCSISKYPMIRRLREKISCWDRITRPQNRELLPEGSRGYLGKRARWLWDALAKYLVNGFVNEFATFILGPAGRKVEGRKVRKILRRGPGELVQNFAALGAAQIEVIETTLLSNFLRRRRRWRGVVGHQFVGEGWFTCRPVDIVYDKHDVMIPYITLLLPHRFVRTVYKDRRIDSVVAPEWHRFRMPQLFVARRPLSKILEFFLTFTKPPRK